MRMLNRFAALLLALPSAACSEPASVNYQVAIELDDNGTPRRGSGVWRFELQEAFPGPYNGTLYGDAIAIELPGRGTVFAILKSKGRRDGSPSQEMAMIPERLFLEQLTRQSSRQRDSRTDGIRAIAAMGGAMARLECGNSEVPDDDPAKICPYLVTFEDPADPSAVVAIDPESISDTFEGVSLSSIAVTVTQEPVTRGVERRLPWVSAYRNMNLEGISGLRTYQSLSRMLTGTDFSMRKQEQ